MAAMLVAIMFQIGQSTAALAQQAASPSQAQQGKQTVGSQESSSGTGDPNARGERQGASYPDAPIAQNTVSSTEQQEGQQNRKPLGTAAAPYSEPSGVMASRPAGAFIAPGRQRRVHAIVISLAIVAAAGIAIGTVSALTHGSPSRP